MWAEVSEREVNTKLVLEINILELGKRLSAEIKRADSDHADLIRRCTLPKTSFQNV